MAELHQGRELRFRFTISPTPLSRVYRCLLKLYPARHPEMLVLDPDPKALAPGRAVPHTYPHEGPGTKLCLWLPKAREWSPEMRLAETYLPWTAQWLDYFEEWLVTDNWAGGGGHPTLRRKDKQRSDSHFSTIGQQQNS